MYYMKLLQIMSVIIAKPELMEAGIELLALEIESA